MAVASRVPAAFGKIVFLGGEVVDVNGLALEHRAAGHPATVDRQPLGGMAGLCESTKDLPPKEQASRLREYFGIVGGARPAEGRGRKGKRP